MLKVITALKTSSQVDDPVVVAEPVDVVLEAVLQRPALELGPRLGPVGGRNHDFFDAPERRRVVFDQPDRLVCHHLWIRRLAEVSLHIQQLSASHGKV